jgi:hypothetical protein
MRDPAPNLAGAASPDQRLWNTYIYWARNALPGPFEHLSISEPIERLPQGDSDALQAILFTAFALEFRLRSVYEALGIHVRSGDGLSALLNNLHKRIDGQQGFTGGIIALPAEWVEVRGRLQALLQLRNRIAHGNRRPVSELLDDRASLRARAADGYNAFIDAVRIINKAIGYEWREGQELLTYYAALSVATDGA